ncbi:AraC family transcriptional regulator [Paenibacillus caui]|uniref:AraC family transcriptional regulator n=1 Tax=Paenibacillus caui TaxID=2873927 RepID=UPI001CAA0F92|nr:AraC family transcriptional regulator [Paenibacillus caui]
MSFLKMIRNPAAASSSEITVLFCGEQQTPPGHKYVQVHLDHVLVHFVLSGRGRFMPSGKAYDLNPGDSFFIFPGEVSGYISDDEQPWKYQWVALKGGYVLRFLKEIGITPESPISSTARPERLIRLYRSIYRTFEQNQVSCDMEAGGTARLLLARYMEDQQLLSPSIASMDTEIKQQINQMAGWINTRYMEPLSIEDMSRQLGYHRTYLTRMFREQLGMSPMQYLTSVRLERAAVLLRSSYPLTIEEVGHSVGYRDALYFSKLFKQKFGTAPSAYRMRRME